jgi:hypothetical protein
LNSNLKRMEHFEIKEGPIRVAYGYERFAGIYLSVCDSRLQSDEKATSQVNAVAHQSFEGAYLFLYTGSGLYSPRMICVDNETMAKFLKRYGATDQQITMLLTLKVEEKRYLEEEEELESDQEDSVG